MTGGGDSTRSQGNDHAAKAQQSIYDHFDTRSTAGLYASAPKTLESRT